MFIQVLGTGCAKCATLAAQAEEAAKETGVEFTLEKVTDINSIAGMGVMITPALIVDGKLKCTGRVPNVGEIVNMLAGER